MSNPTSSPDKRRGLPASFVSAGVIFALVALYFSIGTVFGGKDAAVIAEADTRPDFTVLVQPARTANTSEQISFSGRTEAGRRIVLRAETSGQIRAVRGREGDRVRRGDIVCELEPQSRPAMLAEAQAALAKTEADLAAAERLFAAEFAADAAVKTARAARDAARARVDLARTELANTAIRAPFDAEIAAVRVEPGDLLPAGGECAVLADRSRMIVVAAVPSALQGAIKEGDRANVDIAGVSIGAVVTSRSPVADPMTRAFRVELALDDDPNAPPLADGLAASVRVAGATNVAVGVPRAALVIATDGTLGVRVIDAAPGSDARGTVRFVPVEIIDEAAATAQVTGLANNARIIVRGQEYVSEGVEVAFALAEGVR